MPIGPTVRRMFGRHEHLNAGRLFRGCRERVSFEEETVQAVALEQPGQFDLVVLSDVIHHVPTAMQRELLAAVRRTVAPQGSLIFKDWERMPTPIHWLCHAGDRWLTGDHVDYLSKADAMLAKAFGRAPVVAEARVRPWRNNFAI